MYAPPSGPAGCGWGQRVLRGRRVPALQIGPSRDSSTSGGEDGQVQGSLRHLAQLGHHLGTGAEAWTDVGESR